MSLSCTRCCQTAHLAWMAADAGRTGTFFWVRTTAQSLPLTPTDVMFAAVIALNAYSVILHHTRQPPATCFVTSIVAATSSVERNRRAASDGRSVRTDLVQTTLVGEDGNVSVVACASCWTADGQLGELSLLWTRRDRATYQTWRLICEADGELSCSGDGSRRWSEGNAG